MKKMNLALVTALTAVFAVPNVNAADAADAVDAPTAAETANSRLEKIGSGNDVSASAAYAQADAAYIQARSYFEAVRFHEAKLEVDRALRLFPEHKQAQKLRNDVNAVFGKRGDSLAVLSIWVSSLNDVALQEQALRMVRMLNEGDEFFEAGDFKRAFDRYDRVAVSIRTFTYRFDWGDLPLEVERKLRMAEAKIREEDHKRMEDSRAEALSQQRRKTQVQEDALREKVNQILQGAAEAYNRHDFRRAMVLAWDAYEMDRRREDSRKLYLRARRAGHVQFNDYIREERDERLARVNEEMHQTLIPQTDLLLYPENWFKISLRKPADIGETKEEPWMDDLRARLEEVVTIRFEETPLEDAIAFLRGQTGVNFVIAPEILVDEPPPITLTATNM
ncbi:MAG: hypothetical protein HRU15_05515, partial [Planctomycetes bacterium]|nr:hypothetical protein [Planctomycetota bacterium]